MTDIPEIHLSGTPPQRGVQGEIQPNGTASQAHAGPNRFARTFRLRQTTIDGLLTLADFAGTDATAALEACIVQAAARLNNRERLKLSILAAHCWRAGAISPDRFRELLDMIAGNATAVALRDERRALMPLAKVNVDAKAAISTPTKVTLEVNA
jgi:hypothetical protein